MEDDAKNFWTDWSASRSRWTSICSGSAGRASRSWREFQQAADKRIEIGLVLGEIAEKENLAVTDAEVSRRPSPSRREQQRTTPAAMRAMLETNGAMPGLRNRAQTKKVLDFLRASAIIEGVKEVALPNQARTV